MSDGFVKIYAAMIDSSVWGEDHSTRVVWVTMLAMASARGVVSASVGGLARRAVVSREECQAALEVFLGPDPDSRDGTTGERIAKVDGGWLILNHAKYRERRSQKQIDTAARVAKYRAEKAADDTRDLGPNSVTPRYVTPCNAQKQKQRQRSEAPPMLKPDPKPSPGVQSAPALEQRQGSYWPLVKAYAANFEAAGHGAWMAVDANHREIAAVARWLDANPAVKLEDFTEAWFRDPWAKGRQWPWRHAAKNPARFLAPPAEDTATDAEARAERKDSLRRTQDRVDAARRAVIGGPDPSVDPEGHEELAERLRRAEAAHAKNAGIVA